MLRRHRRIMWPHFSPVLVRFGPFAIHYYALAYITALLIGWRLVRYTASLPPVAATGEQVDDFLSWATLGIILGGRIGYVPFYQPGYFFTHPAQIIAVWDGGMSFHGGFLGVIIAIIWFCRKNHIKILRFADRIAVAVPMGLCLGRIANFINGELWGRPAAPWFPWPDDLPAIRHAGAALPFRTDRGIARRRDAVHHHAARHAFAETAAIARRADRAVRYRLRHRPHHLRMLSRTGCLPRLSAFRHHHGPDPLDSRWSWPASA